MKLIKYLKNHHLILLLALPLFFAACDKEGNPLPSGYKLEIQKDGINFIDEIPTILPPGAKDGPELTYTVSSPGYQTKESLSLRSSPYKKGNRNNKEFSLFLYHPMQGGIELNKQYNIKPIRGKEIVVKGKDDGFSDFESGEPFFRYIVDYDKTYYGTGFIAFTKYGKNQNGTTVAEGSIDFSVPNENGGSIIIKGTFNLPVR
ncbi:hypothetical protein GCM10007415_42470 [Parapedobacter pyrenivorans]|uniref:Lipoprotein n=1 Tax=Parapedobacter pyrenivorans TaxID=1305674 RepID=A0A917I2B5_9SPHI|nr:hypothetical protein [Parapedobacter pyrenivorans]GGH01856.1 hypothetical protein GCM10007415_42470 [Parapedobacter pyrenivorans]